jgi:hypothetical protein
MQRQNSRRRRLTTSGSIARCWKSLCLSSKLSSAYTTRSSAYTRLRTSMAFRSLTVDGMGRTASASSVWKTRYTSRVSLGSRQHAFVLT